jgi:hypothetical protein
MKAFQGFWVRFQLKSNKEFEQLSLGFLHHTSSASFEAEPTLEAEIRQHQKEDTKLQEIYELLKIGKAPHFREDIRVPCGTRAGYVCQM